MADNSQHPLWCNYCEALGHPVTHCHALHGDLTTFAAAAQLAQGPASDPKRACDAAHWGQGKKNAFSPIPSIAPNPGALLNPSEYHAAGSRSVAEQVYDQQQGTQTDETEQANDTEGNETL
ncbi:unnamed protein product [Penicillium glandicola]